MKPPTATTTWLIRPFCVSIREVVDLADVPALLVLDAHAEDVARLAQSQLAPDRPRRSRGRLRPGRRDEGSAHERGHDERDA
jgi:hypothetical protein